MKDNCKTSTQSIDYAFILSSHHWWTPCHVFCNGFSNPSHSSPFPPAFFWTVWLPTLMRRSDHLSWPPSKSFLSIMLLSISPQIFWDERCNLFFFFYFVCFQFSRTLLLSHLSSLISLSLLNNFPSTSKYVYTFLCSINTINKKCFLLPQTIFILCLYLKR